MVFLPTFYIVGIRPKGVGYGSPCARPRSGRSAGFSAAVRGNEGEALYCKRARTEAQNVALRSLYPACILSCPKSTKTRPPKLPGIVYHTLFIRLGCRR